MMNSEVSFTCPRTCAQAEACRFSPLFRAVGPTAVFSHTVKVKVDYGGNPPALEAAVRSMGGTWLGQGRHKLYERGSVNGLGFNLPGWEFPLILTADGSLAFDDYQGRWGNTEDLKTLQARFAVAAARGAAEAQGWMCEDTPQGLTIYHPSGGHLTVNADGTVEAFGFEGVGCHAATTSLADAIGRRAEVTSKPEFFSEKVRMTCGDGGGS